MEYRLNYANWQGCFAAPNQLVEQHLRLSGALQLKVLLYALRYSETPVTANSCATALNLTEQDCSDALLYWQELGLLQSSAASTPAAPEPAAAKVEAPPPKKLPVAKKVKPTGTYLAERIAQSKEVSLLMHEAQQILGKPLSPGMSSTLLFAFEDYGLPVEVLLMLLHYVADLGKGNSHYVDAVARDWAEQGITSLESAEERLRVLTTEEADWRMVERIVGTPHRSPSKREREFATRWFRQWQFSPAMVQAAYEECVDKKHTLSLSYINGVLSRWQRDGIRTIEQLSQDKDRYKAKQTLEQAQQRTYDLDAFEEMDFTREKPQN